MNFRLPNLLIPGAAKSGTTSLYHYLAAHPQCGMSRPKETYFFTKGFVSDQLERYAAYFSHINSETPIVGDGSPTYLSVPVAAERIRDVLGENIKLIFLLRDPVERAISAYCHVQKKSADRRHIREVLIPPCGELSEALEWENTAIGRAGQLGLVDASAYTARHDDAHWNFRYLRNSTYLTDLRRFRNLFCRSRMLIILTEQLRESPASVFRRIATFLEIDPDVLPENLNRRYNTTQLAPRGTTSRFVRAFARRLPVGPRWRQAILQATTQEKPDLSVEDRQTLRHLFRSHNRQLSEEFGVPTDEYWGNAQDPDTFSSEAA